MIDWLYRIFWQTGITLLLLTLLTLLFQRLSPSIRCWLWRAGYLKCLITMGIAASVAVPLLPASPVVSEVSASLYEPVYSAEPKYLPSVYEPTIAAPVADRPVISLESTIIGLYLLGVTLVLVRWGQSLIKALRLRHGATLIDPRLATELAARLGLRRVPRIARHPDLQAPLYTFWGVFLPESVRPDEALTLAHELAHARRNDLFWEVLGGLIQVVLWWHPLVWWTRRQEQLAREQATDALALSVSGVAPADYARALFTAATGRRTAVLAVGAFDRPSLLRQRIMALGKPSLTPAKTRLCTGLLALAALLAILPWRATARQAPKPKSVSPVASRQREARIHFGKVQTLGLRSLLPVVGAKVTLLERAVDGWEPSADIEGGKTVRYRWVELDSMRTGADGTFRWNRPFAADAIQVSAIGLATTRRESPEPEGWRVTMQLPVRWEAIVMDEKGRPFAGKGIKAVNGQSGRTDSQGRFVVHGVEKVTWSDPLFQLTEPGWVLRKQGVTEQRDSTIRRFIALRGQAIEGQLVTQKGEPVPDAWLHITAYEKTGSERTSAISDKAGRFHSKLLLPGNYLVTVRPGHYPGEDGLAPKELPRMTIPNRNGPLRMVLTPGMTVRGVVTESKTGKPVKGVLVVATRPSRPEGHPLSRVPVEGVSNSTDAQGRYSLPIPPGERVMVTVHTSRARISQRETNLAIAILPGGKIGQEVTRNFTIRLKEPVTGQVVSEQGRPVAGAALIIPGMGVGQQVGATDQNGQFSIPEDHFFINRPNSYQLIAKKGKARGAWQGADLKSRTPLKLILK